MDERVLDVLGREHARTVLEATATPKSAPALSEEYDIPIATCYRRLHQQTEVGLLEESVTVDESNSAHKEFKRTVDEISIEFHGEEMVLSLDTSEEATSRIDTIWSKVRRS